VACFRSETKLIIEAATSPGVSNEPLDRVTRQRRAELLPLRLFRARHRQAQCRSCKRTPVIQKAGAVISLPGLQYELLHAGPGGARPLRSEDVKIRYVGRLSDGSIFSTSAQDGAQASTFSVRTVIPGFSALVQLMSTGDRWRFTIPAYLGYGHQGRRFNPPEETLKRDIPPESTLIFDVELVAIMPAR
jgi:FKBP-type peptidyl-prolyl cis-trans isomerase